ncbi:MAG: CTQ-dependent glycine oxidase GoxA [Alphaproteobacteria bacterium]|nr:CTQ-dependent glycine oxidase GoxA [Alphaproteobacteria bacterium]
MTDKKQAPVTRRDFLYGASIVAMSFPFLAKSSVSLANVPEVAPRNAAVARLAIYPAIGISRVGGSDKWYLSPEVPGSAKPPEGGYKDGMERIKKQVQRFRVYAFDSKDRIIREIKADEAKIKWDVHVANTKAAWYGFRNPMDNGEEAPGIPGKQRNPSITSDKEREKMLIIDGGKTSISGSSIENNGRLFKKDNVTPRYSMEGKFYNEHKVNLGELRTDENGRLLVFPANGTSKSPVNASITSFSDNESWYDDLCDGSINATVTFDTGQEMKADGAWICTVGPNFAPEIAPIISLYDVIQDLNIKKKWDKVPESPLSYRKYIHPIFHRLALMDWVSGVERLRTAWTGTFGDLSNQSLWHKLHDPSRKNKAFRQDFFSKMRNKNKRGNEDYHEERMKMPFMPGEGVDYENSPLLWLSFTELQRSYLERWVSGDFIDDYEEEKLDMVSDIDDLDLALRPHALTEAALEPCSGGAFHPGVELSYYLRHAPMYARNNNTRSEPFRIARGNRPALLHNIGRQLNPKNLLEGGNGSPPPIGPQMPGDLTRWMGLPWQSDAFSCQQVLMRQDFPVAVWWPALLPIDVLPEEYYRQLMRTDLTPKERRTFFETRVSWSRGVPGIGHHANASYWDGITHMVYLWERLGFIVRKDGPKGTESVEGIPEQLFVESERGPVELLYNANYKEE